MDKVHIYAIKRFPSVPLHSSNKMLYGETGRYPLFVNTWVKCIKCIKYWLKLNRFPMSRLCRQACERLLLQHEPGHLICESNVQQIVCENFFAAVWVSKGIGYGCGSISEFTDRLTSCCKQRYWVWTWL
eukprot:TRINITY_DN15294_c0_g1_i12.p1 TRINITY_DN15294_c0_g1~~TRINITY_DN15294_c0_g1_i12.p1  ORF type:complete len:129 (-),score=4.40 TRINITY_DN15294_c0_g1_i12:1-387(-)